VGWLEAEHGLRARVTPGGVVVARPREGAIGKLGAGVRRAQGRGGLAKVSEVQASAVSAPGAEVGALVVVADVGARRASAIAGGSVVAAGGGVVIGAVALVAGSVVLVALPAAVGLGAAVARVGHRRTVRRTRRAVEETADRIAVGDGPPGLLTSLRSPRLRRGAGRADAGSPDRG
jgi:hypothetical protein